MSKVDLRLLCGMPCSKLEVSTVQHGTFSGAAYLHQSPRGTLPDVHLLAGGCVSLPTRQFWRGSQGAPGVVTDALRPGGITAMNELHPKSARHRPMSRFSSSKGHDPDDEFCA